MSVERHSDRENSTEEGEKSPKWLGCSRPGKQWRMVKGKVYRQTQKRKSKLRSDCKKDLQAVPRRMTASSRIQHLLECVVRKLEFHRILI